MTSREFLQIRLNDPRRIGNQLLHFFKEEKWMALYNSNGNKDAFAEYDLLAGVGMRDQFCADTIPSLVNMELFLKKSVDWLFGYISYDVKNEIEELRSENPNPLDFPFVLFFQPRYAFQLKGQHLSVGYFGDMDRPEDVKRMVDEITKVKEDPIAGNDLSLNTRMKKKFTREEYIKTASEIKNHIRLGDIYEMNFCMEFFAENAEIDPYSVYQGLNRISEAPFSAFCRYDDKFILSSSPERFLKKSGSRIISQPMKGTMKRSDDQGEDNELKNQLIESKKEQNENVMIVDIVRNDLSRLADKGSVEVSELFGVRSYRQVHQMISTVETNLRENSAFTDVLKAVFPMGSMTGAPKIRAMQLIDHYERSRRGVYSGALGYVAPGGDFDFSVVIRAILYNASKKNVSFTSGSAITDLCDPEKEYEECLLKAFAMMQALNASLDEKC